MHPEYSAKAPPVDSPEADTSGSNPSGLPCPAKAPSEVQGTCTLGTSPVQASGSLQRSKGREATEGGQSSPEDGTQATQGKASEGTLANASPPRPIPLQATRTLGRLGPGKSNSAQAIAYLRASTSDQKLSPEAQRAAIEAFARREGIAVLGWYVDAGISGAAPIEERPALLAALDACRVNRCGLLVAKRDRLARDAMIAAMVERSLPKGARVLAADGTGNGSAPADALMRTILDGMAEYERALIRSRTKAALQAKRARGERAGRLPFGFDVDASGKLTPREDEQAAIARIRSLAASGEGQRAIVRILASEGVAGRTGRPLGLSQVQRILAG
jgi:DNA invertase Pin-like site-specific DNA recombinase